MGKTESGIIIITGSIMKAGFPFELLFFSHN